MKMRKTKIICTLGPASENEQVIRELMLAGMNVASLNFSHGTHEEQRGKLEIVKKVREELKLPVALLLDTKGPEIRTGLLENDGKVRLHDGDEFILTGEEVVGNEKRVSLTYPQLCEDVKPGATILIDDGLIALEVKEIRGRDIVCTVKNGGELGQRKGINVPDVSVKLPAITEKDREDIIFGISQGIDFIAASFVRDADAIREIKDIIK